MGWWNDNFGSDDEYGYGGYGGYGSDGFSYDSERCGSRSQQLFMLFMQLARSTLDDP